MTEDSPSILNKIVKQRQSRLADSNIDISKLSIEKSNRSLVDGLQSSETGFILECKKSSPSRGLLTDNYQPGLIAQQYQSFATAVSVLTEPDFFSGSLDDLSEVRKVINQPLLCKDFVIQTSQLYAARAAGADIILLMLSVVTDEFWLECFKIANQLGLDIITEVNNQQEVERAIALPAKIIGINNRNLHTLKTDVIVTHELAKLIPDDRLIISESGISSHNQLKELAPIVDGFLIGSSLMQSANLALGLRKLIFGEVKICGLTSREDAELAWQLGASFGGIIFTPKSPRYMEVEQAKSLCEEQPMPMVGVFMDQSSDEIIDAVKQLNLSVVQLHGKESIDYINELKQNLPTDCEIWKAISCSEVDDSFPTIVEAIAIKENYLKSAVDRVLIDLPKALPNEMTGSSLDYKNFLYDEKVFLAGGIDIDTPLFRDEYQAGIDICSSVESAPRIKDSDKMKQLFSRLQPTTRNHYERN